MTIIAAVSWTRQDSAPLNLAAQISRCAAEKIIAATIVERVSKMPLAQFEQRRPRIGSGGAAAVEQRDAVERLTRDILELRLEFGDVPVKVHDTMVAPAWCHRKAI